jgi:hypothetical protein
MKKTAACLAITSSILLSTATLLQGAEQKITFNTERIEFKSGTNPIMCQDICSKKSGPDAKSLLSQGWKIVSSSPKQVIGEDYWFVPCNTCKPHGCTCIGTEYLLQRDEPAPGFETSNQRLEAPDRIQRGGNYTPNVETSINELDLLKKKNQLLINEISILKQENETLKKLLRSKLK